MYSLRPEKHVAGVVHCQFYKKSPRSFKTITNKPFHPVFFLRRRPCVCRGRRRRQAARFAAHQEVFRLRRHVPSTQLPSPSTYSATAASPSTYSATAAIPSRSDYLRASLEFQPRSGGAGAPSHRPRAPASPPRAPAVHLELPPVRHRDPPTGIVGAGLHDPVDRSSRASSVVSHVSPWCSFSACVPAGGASPCCCILFLLCFSPATGGANPCCCCSSSRVDATALPVLLLLIRAVLLLLLLTPAVTAAAGAICTLKKVLHQSTAT
ncbi:hypothetical protein VPH35_020460 [Triticum aestivum]|uniref:Uncharacterized protein n=1 Tax=Triticum turgidum subsp. durum TaxID=4567 RepID=A0A9R1R5T2_TRITD|nr:unnamed protein product [Triticum turgidum subsp. durum]